MSRTKGRFEKQMALNSTFMVKMHIRLKTVRPLSDLQYSRLSQYVRQPFLTYGAGEGI